MQFFRTNPLTYVFSRSSSTRSSIRLSKRPSRRPSIFFLLLALVGLPISGLPSAFGADSKVIAAAQAPSAQIPSNNSGKESTAQTAIVKATSETLQPVGKGNSGDTKPSITAAEWTPLVLWTATKPNPFEGSDNKYHLAYDIVLTNFSSKSGVLKQIDVINPSSGKLLLSLSGKSLGEHVTKYNEKELHFAPCECAIGWINLDFDHKADVPPKICHRVVFDTLDQEVNTRIQDDKADVLVEQIEPVVISPPLKGDKWVAIGGYIGRKGHRRALLALSNHLFAAQTYAIDWVKLDHDNNLIIGDPTKNESNYSYGQPVLAVVDATVAGVIDRFDDQVPDKPAGQERLEFPTGNTVILDLGHGYFATYAHLKRGSIKVKEGDHVSRGQVFALIGNSGSSKGAHLHFHITKGVGPLNSPGIPYVIDNFEITDEIQDIEKFMDAPDSPKSLPLNPSEYKGKHVLQLPREASVVKFAE